MANAINFPKLLLGRTGAIMEMLLSQSRSFAGNGVPKRELGNQKRLESLFRVGQAVDFF
jgi:hypothetical protein